MKYSLRSLMIAALVLPPVIAGSVFLWSLLPPFRTVDWMMTAGGGLCFLAMLVYVLRREYERQQGRKSEQKEP